MQTGPTSGDRQFATALTAAADIDLVVHHGPHVVQPVERVNGAVVYWSVGNFVSGMGTAGSGRYADLRTLDGLLATVRFTETTPGRFTAESRPVVICTSRLDRSVHAAISELADPTAVAAMTDSRRRELLDCIARTRAVQPDLS
jgi:poly-gamma-glutamate synthesis protein (capsule biosynthesis protein)